MKKTFLACILVLAFSATAVFAETIYLKDGTVVHGRIVKVDETSVMIEAGDSWKRIERSAIELIKPDELKTTPPASAAGVPVPAIAPKATRREGPGLYIGLQVPYNMIEGDFGKNDLSWIDPGLGLGLIAGYSFDPYLGLEIDLAGSSHQRDGRTISFAELSLNLKYNVLSATDKASPFLFAGIGSFMLGDEHLLLGGYGYNLGVGVDIPVSVRNTIGITVIRKIITYDEILESDYLATIQGTIRGDTTSIRLDLTHHF